MACLALLLGLSATTYEQYNTNFIKRDHIRHFLPACLLIGNSFEAQLQSSVPFYSNINSHFAFVDVWPKYSGSKMNFDSTGKSKPSNPMFLCG
ncbi:MAG: hypothetical protein PSX36_09280 [bacterium]|nr:hypothetical protein [bacterium]